ncbi:MAG: hypothetical protein GY842_11220 [bacterium]|nr:hypothetical protein [bacterium]
MSIDGFRGRRRHLTKMRGDTNPVSQSSEQSLDSLLSAHEERAAAARPQSAGGTGDSRMEMFRRRLANELIPAFDELKAKYAEQGLDLKLDASDFLEGGRRLIIEFTWQSQAVRLDGTVTDAGVAFNEIRSAAGVPGAICSGPMLRIHRVTIDDFREFVCAHIAVLVRSVMRLQR